MTADPREIKVWKDEVYEAEHSVERRVTFPMEGGRKDNETVEAYLQRARAKQDEAVERLAYARQKLASLTGGA